MRRTALVVLLILVGVLPAAGQTPNTINTIAGGGGQPSAATSAFLPVFAAVRDTAGNVYVAVPTLNTVYVVNTAGTLSVYAGTGISGFLGDGGPATQAQLSFPTSLAIDSKNNLFIADSNNNRIRRVDATTPHNITTVAGSEDPFNGAYAGDGGPATNARLNNPAGVAVDGNGDLFIADTFNQVVRRVDGGSGVITTYAGTPMANKGCPNGPAVNAGFTSPQGVAVDGSGNVFVSDARLEIVCKVDTSQNISVYAGQLDVPETPGQGDGDNGPATSAPLLSPHGLATDAQGDLFITDSGSPKIRKVGTNGIITTVAGVGFICGTGGITLTEPGCGDGGPAASAALNFPRGVFADTNGLLIADTGDQRVRSVGTGANPVIAALAGGGSGGDGGPATSAILGLAQTLAVDSSENVYALETSGVRIRKIAAASPNDITTIAGIGVGGATQGAAPLNGDGGPASSARFVDPQQVARDASGSFYITDSGQEVVRFINNSGASVTIGGVTVANGDIATIAGNGKQCGAAGNPNTFSNNCGFTPTGANPTSVSFFAPTGVAVDASGNVYIADAVLNIVGVINASSGTMTVFAGQVGQTCSTYPTNCGDGGTPTSALLNAPEGLATFVQGGILVVFIADAGDNVIRMVNTEQVAISQVVFNGLPSFGGDGGEAILASMEFPEEIAIDELGNVYIAGGVDNVVQRYDANAQTIINVAGDVNNLGGGFSGDGGPSTQALISNFGVAVAKNSTGTHDLFIADSGSNRIRKVNLAPVVTNLSPANNSTLQFPPTLAGASTFQQTTLGVLAANMGLDTLVITVTAPAPTSDFQLPGCQPVGAVPCTLTVSPLLSGGVQVTFAPPAGVPAGNVTGTLTFTTNDPKNPGPFNYNMAGSIGAAKTLNVTVTPAGDGTVFDSTNSILCNSTTETNCSSPFPAGGPVSLVASPNSGFSFVSWNGVACNGGNTTAECDFTMPAATVNITATFTSSTAGPPVTVTVQGAGNGSGTVTALAVTGAPLISCTITNGSTANSPGPCQATVAAGTQVTLTPAITGNSVFAGWLGGICSDSNVGPCNVFGGTVSAVFSGPLQPFAKGDVFLSEDDGMVFVYNSTGTLKDVLNSGTTGGRGAGMAFDSNGRLFLANNGASNPTTGVLGAIEIFSPTNGAVSNFGTGFNSPYSVAIDPFNNVYLGQLVISEGNQVLEFAKEANGSPTTTFFPAYEGPSSGSTWVDLLADNETLAYTLGTQTVKIFDTGELTQHADLITNLHGAHALRALPDNSILVADSDRIVRLDQNGNEVSPYPVTIPGGGIFFNLNLDPDGLSFWTNDEETGNVYRVNISTGTVMSPTPFTTPLGLNASIGSLGIGGIAVFGGQQSGAGADLAITMNAPANAQVGANLTYTLTVTNNGPDAATGIVVSDTLPAGLTADLATDFSSSCTGTDILACTIGNLGVGQTATVVINVVPTATGTLQNTATVSGNQVDPNSANNMTTGSTTVVNNGVPVTVEVSSTNSADFVTSSPAGINCAADQACTVFFAPNGTLTLTANGPNFAGWTVISPPGASCPGTGACVLSNLTVQAFVVASYSSPVGFTVPPGAALGEGVVGVPYAVDLSQGILGGTAPYTFSLTTGTLPPGLGLGTGACANGTTKRLCGTPTTVGTFPITLKVTDSTTPTPTTATFSTSITVINPPGGQEGLLNGLYAILFRGVSDADASLRDFVASVPFDGKGGIMAGGSFDANGNGANGLLQTGLTITGGTYTIGNDFRGLANVILSDGTTRIFAFSVGDVYKTTGLAYSIYLVEFDDNSGSGIRGAGLGKRQDTTAFTPASLAGTYVVGRTGESTTLQRFTESGLIGLNASGLFTALNEEFNNNGTTGTDTLISGTYGTDAGGSNGMISSTGRTQTHVMFTDTPTGGSSTTKTADTAVVIVDANTLFALKISSGATETLFAGIDHRQLNLGNFSPSSINGPYVLNLQGSSGANTSSNAAVLLGLLNTNGSTVMSVTLDANNAGAILENITATGTVGATSNGRATFSFGSTALTAYFWDLNHAFAMSSGGADPGFGTIELQHGGPFPNTSITDFTIGQSEPSSPSGGPVSSGVFTACCQTTENVTQDLSHERGTLDYGMAVTTGFTTEPNGRVVVVVSSASDVSDTVIGYDVSPSRSYNATIDPTEHHPHIGEVNAIPMPAGVPSPLTTTIAFGTVAKGSTATMPVALTNTGDGLLSITGFTNATDFSISGPCVATLPTAPVVLPAQGGSCTGTITFSPAASTNPGAVSETIMLPTDFGTIVISLTGTVAPPASCSGTNNWNGSAGDGQWTTATNWSLGAIPVSTDDVCINSTFASSTIKIGTLAAANQTINSLNSSASLDLQGGPLSLKAAIAAANAVTIESSTTLTLNGAGTIGGALTLSGTLAGTGAITVTGPITWNGNALMNGTGSTTANGGITFNIPAGMDAGMDSRTLNNGGTATWPGAASEGLLLDTGATVNNLTGAIWNFASDNGISGDGSGIFNNAGTFEKTGGTGTSVIQTVFNNTGSVSVTPSGTTLNLANGGSCGSACGGSFNVSTGATLQFGGGTFALKGQIAGPGAIRFAAVTVSSTGVYNVTGGTTVSSGTANFNSGATISSVGPLTVSGGTLNFSTGSVVPISVPSVNLTGGTLTGTDTLTSTGLFNWFGPSTMSGTGMTNASGGGSIQGNVILNARTLNTSGTVTLGNATAPAALALQNNAVVNNLSGGTWNFLNGSGSNAAIGGDGTGTFSNAGTFEMTGGTNNLLLINFTNNGTVMATTGTFNFQGSYSQRAGSTSLNGGSLSASTGQTISGIGTISGNISTPAGTLAPGTPSTAGSLTVNGTGAGNYQAMTGNYNVAVGGTAASQVDTTTLAGTAAIGNATLKVALLNGFTPAAGQSFTILTAGTINGQFAASNLPTLTGGLTMQVAYTATTVTLNVVAAAAPPMFSSTSLPTGALGVAYGADLSALVTGGVPPYTFALANGSTLPAGFTFDTTGNGNVMQGHIFNDNPTTAATSTFMVTVSDSSPTPQTATATISLTIGAAPANTQAALVKGQWALLERSFSENNGGEDGALASLKFDGVNAVTGVVDINSSGSSGIQTQVPVTGNYSVASDNTMFVILTAPSSACTSPPCTISFVMAVGSVYRNLAYSATVTEFNDDNGNDSIGSGFMLRQDTTAFNNNAIAGTDVFGLTGQTPNQQRVAETGIVTLDNALNVKSGSADINEAGTLGSLTSITGKYTTPDSNGHTVLSLTLTPGGAAQTSVYVVSANELVAMSLDSRATKDLLMGTALRQVAPAGGFGAGSIAGPDVLTLEDLQSDGGFDVIVGLATVSSGTLSVTFDEESDGKTPTIGGVTSGLVTVGTNGRLSSQLTAGAGNGSTLIAYLATPGRGFALGSGSGVPAGELKPQVGAPFSATPFGGNIFFGFEEILGPNSSISGVGALQSGTATFNITDSESHNGGDLSFHQSAGALTLTVASDGSFTGSGTQGIGSSAGYLVSPYEFDLIDTTDSAGTPSNHPHVIVAQTLTAPPGTPSPAAFTLNFANPVTIGSTAQSSPMTITNVGSGPFAVTGVNTANSPDFKIDPSSSCVGTVTVIIQPLAACTLLTDFAPTTSTPTGTMLSENIVLTTDGTTSITITDTGTAQAAVTPDFSLAVTPASQTVPNSTGSTTYTVTPTALNGFSGSVMLAVSGLPTGATGTFSPNPVAVGQSPITSTLTVTTSTAPPGTYTLTITGTSGSLQHTATTMLVVTASASPDFSLSAMPGSQTVSAGANTTYTVNAGALNGFTGTVALTLGGLPTGATGTFKPTSIAAGTPSTLTVTTSASTPAGTSTLTITGMSGTLVHTATVQLVVNQVLASINVTPASAILIASATQQYTATGIFGDKSTQNITNSVTWASSNTAVATISNATGTQGLATAVKAGGPVNITATQGSIQGTATLTVTDFTVSATPPSQTVNAGSGTTFTVNAAALNGFTGNVALTLSGQPTGVTGTFTPSSIAPGTPSTLALTVPLATPAGTSALTITGSSGGVTRTATVQLVVNQVLQSIAVTPNPANVGVNNTLQFTATGMFGDKSTQNLTNSVHWTSSDTTIATISNTEGSQGVATGVKSGGPITITASQTQNEIEISGTAQLTVTQIILAPPPGTTLAPPPVAPGGTLVVPIVLTVPPGTKGTAMLSCAVTFGPPGVSNPSEFINCLPVPGQVVLTGTGSTNTALVMKLFCSDLPGAPTFRKVPGGFGPLGLLLCVMAIGGLCVAMRRRPRWAMSFAVLALIALGTASCSSPEKGPAGPTPPGNYVVTLTATLNGESASLNISVVVE
jgi:trimeric autotransporter adhesin